MLKKKRHLGKGGSSTLKKYGVEHFRQMGCKGGKQVAAVYSSEHYQELGRKGGKATKERHGRDHYRRIGRLGGTHRRKLTQRGSSRPDDLMNDLLDERR